MSTAQTINLMEVCGTHTMAIARAGLRSVFPKNLHLLSGPGCPICVTATVDIDRALFLARRKNTIITTFGDMLHVPGSSSSLEKERAAGADVRILYSPVDALDLARQNPSADVVFLGVGFETTSPAIAATVLAARKKKIANFSVLPLFKTIPQALRMLLNIKSRTIHGFILPGHVSAIIGTQPYDFIAREFGVPGVVTGFEPQDIMTTVNRLTAMVTKRQPAIEIQYTRAVTPEGNREAQALLREVFVPVDSRWRAIGILPGSGLAFAPAYESFNACSRFNLPALRSREPKGCRCGDILLGLAQPRECPLFGTACTPRLPVGPCMVSSEGPCAAEYQYGSQKPEASA